MKQINIFGRELKISFENKKNKDSNKKLTYFESLMRYIKSNKLNFRLLLLIATFFAFFMIIKVTSNSERYYVGQKIDKDIIATKTISYTEDITDEQVKNRIVENTEPVYDSNKEIVDKNINLLNEVFEKLDSLERNENTNEISQDELRKVIELYNLNITSDSLGEISKKKSSERFEMAQALLEIYNKGIKNLDEINESLDIIKENNKEFSEAEIDFLKNFIEVNLSLNEEETSKKINENINSLENQPVVLRKGDIVAQKGDKLTIERFEVLKKLNLVSSVDIFERAVGNILTFIFFSIIFYYLLKKYCSQIIDSKAYYPSYISVLIMLIIYTLFFINASYFYLFPFVVITILLAIIGDKLFSLIVSIFSMFILINNIYWLFITIAIMAIAIYKIKDVRTRTDFINLGMFLGAIKAILVVVFGLINQNSFGEIVISSLFAVFSGIFVGMICIAILPYFENTFKLLTNIKLLELSDFSHPLLKSLLVKAPGTFHHSIMVGALSERATEAIGANSTFARVASYYHDIGKMKRPNFFVENQSKGENPHDSISPNLSALIIMSHTKDGVLLGKKYALPEEILEIMTEHHGTTLVQYFYNKAKEINPNVKESEFRYNGKKPKTKESTVIFLADTIEAAVRSSDDKSKDSIERLIRYLIKQKIDDGQLMNADLTFKEIELIISAFIEVLGGAYHQRIKYPKMDENKNLVEIEEEE